MREGTETWQMVVLAHCHAKHDTTNGGAPKLNPWGRLRPNFSLCSRHHPLPHLPPTGLAHLPKSGSRPSLYRAPPFQGRLREQKLQPHTLNSIIPSLIIFFRSN